MIKVEPRITLAGRVVSCDIEQLDRLPIAMESFTCNWGRDSYFAETAPATLSATLWDATDDWATRIRDGAALGVHVIVEYQIPNVGWVPQFRGIVTSAKATQHPTRKSPNGRHVWVVSLLASDPTQALGSIYPLPGAFSAKRTMTEHRAWLHGLCAYGGLVLSGIDFDQTKYGAAKLSPLPVGQDSALELMRKFFASMGETFTYNPESNRVRATTRMSQHFTTSLCSFDDSRGAVLITAGDFSPPTGGAVPGVGLSACELAVDDGITIEAALDNDINTVEMTREQRGTVDDEWQKGSDMRSTLKDVPNGQPIRLYSFTTDMWEHYYTAQAGYVLTAVFAKARGEGRKPKHPPLSYKPGKSFATERMARWWLRTTEDARPGFINGDKAHEWLMAGDASWPPLMSPLGGTVMWHGIDGWSITMNVQWMNDLTQNQPIVYENLQQLKWSSSSPDSPWWWGLIGMPPPHPVYVGEPTPERDVRYGRPEAGTGEEHYYRFDESITFEDMKHLDNESREIKDLLT